MVAFGVLNVGGCAHVITSPELADLPALPMFQNEKLSEDSFVIEVGFVLVPESGPTWKSSVWSELDEQHLDPESRRRLAMNGIRCGLSGTQLPMGLRAALDVGGEEPLDSLQTIGDMTERAPMHRRIRRRAGKPIEIVSQPMSDSMVVLLHDDEDVVGKTYYQAQPRLILRCFPVGDGRSRVELTPEIQHGPIGQRWIGQDGAFQLDASQQREVFSKVAIEAILAPGQSMVLAGSGASRSLGGNLFGVDQDDQKEKMLLIRLAQSQNDDLFTSTDHPSMDAIDVIETPETSGPLVLRLGDAQEGVDSNTPSESAGPRAAESDTGPPVESDAPDAKEPEQPAHRPDGTSLDGLTIDLE